MLSSTPQPKAPGGIRTHDVYLPRYKGDAIDHYATGAFVSFDPFRRGTSRMIICRQVLFRRTTISLATTDSNITHAHMLHIQGPPRRLQCETSVLGCEPNLSGTTHTWHFPRNLRGQKRRLPTRPSSSTISTIVVSAKNVVVHILYPIQCLGTRLHHFLLVSFIDKYLVQGPRFSLAPTGQRPLF